MLQLNIITLIVNRCTVNACNFCLSWRSISVNFTNFAQFHIKKERTKISWKCLVSWFSLFFSLLTFHEAYNIKLFNVSFLIMWKLVFAKIIIFHISELNVKSSFETCGHCIIHRLKADFYSLHQKWKTTLFNFFSQGKSLVKVAGSCQLRVLGS